MTYLPPTVDSLPPLAPARRRSGWLRVSLFAATGALLVVSAVAGVGLLWLRAVAKAALPQLDGDVHLTSPGQNSRAAPVLSAPVLVRRDAHGVPHIEAATQADLFVAQGYVTAQDRLWQMDATRRAAAGELAEILGSRLVQNDKTQRVLEIRRTAERIYSRMPAADRAVLDDYARGVNLYIAQCERDRTLPPEFRLLRYRPRPWTGVDSVSVGLMMVETLDLRVASKLSRARIEAKLGDRRLVADLYPVGSWRDRPPTGVRRNPAAPQPGPAQNDDEDDDNTEVHLTPNPAVQPFASAAPENPVTMALLGETGCAGCAVGSNSWVIAGAHTASGRPLLANDMHLTLREPDNWYIADLDAPGRNGAPGFHAAGVTLPGFPLVIAGHNEHVAWGFTALYADVSDLYTEKLDGKGDYEGLDGKWHRLAVDREVIHVRGGRDVVVNVESTAHGPLLNPLLAAGDPPLALQWTLYDSSLNALPLEAMNAASNWQEFSAALAEWCWPTQNLVYADDQGHIAYHAIGKVPMRPGGLMSVPIRDAAHEWRGAIPFAQMPNAFDPPAGFLATANSRVTTRQSPYPLTDDWADPYRIERIDKLLDGRDGLTPADMLAAQMDIYSEVDQQMAHRLAEAIDRTPGSEGNGDARMRQAADLLRNWDGRLTTGSAAASLVTETRTVLWPMLLAPRLGKLAGAYQWGESNFALEEIVMDAKPAWLPRQYKSWNALLTAAVRKAMSKGHAPADVSRWSYGSWHTIQIEHPLVKFLPFLSRIAGTGPQPLNGDVTTVKQAGRTLGPSQRFTMDWSNIDGSTENIVLGESGNPLSLYFRDQWNDWYDGTTFALPFTPAAVAAQTRHTLRLLP